ncbi:host cell division inhibitor Icd-like protein, partial [Escherichia coli]|nr:host cell division inhibitor Icd-like protein [Escherichia coli]
MSLYSPPVFARGLPMCKNRLQKIITGLYSSCVAHMA